MAFQFFNELSGSPTFNFRPFASTATRVGRIPGNRLTDLLNELFPVGLQPRALSSDFPWLFAQGLHAEPHFGEGEKIAAPASGNLDLDSLNTYGELLVRIEYGTGQPGNDPDGQGDDPAELLETRWTAGGEFMTVPPGGVQWHPVGDGETGKVSQDVEVGLLIPTFEMMLRWPRVQNPPFSVIRDRIGSVNNAEFGFKTGACAPETLLFLGAELSRTVLTTGALAWDVVYRFSERRVPLAASDTIGGQNGASSLSVGGWNHFFRSEWSSDDDPLEEDLDGKTGFYRLKVKPGRTGGDDPIYQLKSFAELFQQGS